MKTSLISIYIASCLTIMLGGFFLIAFWLFYPYQVFTFSTERNKILTPVVQAGQQVIWETNVYHHTEGKIIEISRVIEDGFLINLPDTSYISQKGQSTFNNSSVMVPKYTPPGIYHITIYNRVHVNPLRTILVIRKTEEFKVVAP